MTTSAACPRRLWPRILVVELGHAVGWILLFGVLAVGFLLAHLTIPALAEAQRWAARRLGASAPSGRRPGEPVARWLTSRVATAAFWRQDLPLVGASLLLGLPSLLVAMVGGVSVVVALSLPWVVSGGRPVRIGLWDYTHPLDAWWAVPVGLVLGAACLTVLVGIGRARLLMVGALSRDGLVERAAMLDAQVGDLRRSRATLVDAFEAERARIERDLHDGVQQHLSALAMALGAVRLSASRVGEKTHREAILARVARAQQEAEAALADLRSTVRAVRPAVLSDRGLAAAVRELCAGSGLQVDVEVDGDDSRISPPVATAVYFAVSEALTNVARHAGVGAARVRLECSAEAVEAVVEDQGAGGAVVGRSGRGAGGTGLVGMQQRLATVGGELEVDSPAGVGTRVRMLAPALPPW